MSSDIGVLPADFIYTPSNLELPITFQPRTSSASKSTPMQAPIQAPKTFSPLPTLISTEGVGNITTTTTGKNLSIRKSVIEPSVQSEDKKSEILDYSIAKSFVDVIEVKIDEKIVQRKPIPEIPNTFSLTDSDLISNAESAQPNNSSFNSATHPYSGELNFAILDTQIDDKNLPNQSNINTLPLDTIMLQLDSKSKEQSYNTTQTLSVTDSIQQPRQKHHYTPPSNPYTAVAAARKASFEKELFLTNLDSKQNNRQILERTDFRQLNLSSFRPERPVYRNFNPPTDTLIHQPPLQENPRIPTHIYPFNQRPGFSVSARPLIIIRRPPVFDPKNVQPLHPQQVVYRQRPQPPILSLQNPTQQYSRVIMQQNSQPSIGPQPQGLQNLSQQYPQAIVQQNSQPSLGPQPHGFRTQLLHLNQNPTHQDEEILLQSQSSQQQTASPNVVCNTTNKKVT